MLDEVRPTLRRVPHAPSRPRLEHLAETSDLKVRRGPMIRPHAQLAAIEANRFGMRLVWRSLLGPGQHSFPRSRSLRPTVGVRDAKTNVDVRRSLENPDHQVQESWMRTGKTINRCTSDTARRVPCKATDALSTAATDNSRSRTLPEAGTPVGRGPDAIAWLLAHRGLSRCAVRSPRPEQRDPGRGRRD